MTVVRQCAVWHAQETIELREQVVPSLKSGEALLKVEACAVCGSDLRIYKHGNPRVASGQIVGHEISGSICEVANEAGHWNPGDRVAVGADVPCGECVHCRSGRPNCCDVNYAIGHQFEGGFTQYMVLNQLTLACGPVTKLTSETDFDHAALAEPLACCINGYERGLMQDGKNVVIFGAGPIGMMLAMLAPLYRASQVILIDPNESRLQKARDMGLVTHTLNPATTDVVDAVVRLTHGTGGEMIFTACPAVETHEQAIAMVAKRGVVNLFGGLPHTAPSIAVNSNFIHYREAYVTGSHGSTPRQHAQAVNWIESGAVPVGRLITHRIALNQIHDAYKIAASGDAIKVIVKPHSS
jgi:L-iditol 2-dehydrogenase